MPYIPPKKGSGAPVQKPERKDKPKERQMIRTLSVTDYEPNHKRIRRLLGL